MTDDSTQDEPIMSGSDEATADEKAAGLDEQARADAEFYEGNDRTKDGEPEADPKGTRYVNPSSSALDHPQADAG